MVSFGCKMCYGCLNYRQERRIPIFDLKVNIYSWLLLEEGICSERTEDIHPKVDYTLVSGMHELCHVLQFVIYSLDDESLAQHQFVI